ncbi:uncharacterized protein TRUGW13939_05024 [Talaromyces rugulosus]|uniref:Uncharacterized protein n=1 Tax=Talaromyces rugulosus TaxID=121627 RepID=A0A7H8QV55_TALRU|nr:uncharacterized protein TRUGW13939_05024 [Talaromyces rugulosus]QKX57904.1 hypothetical protein TRUGW13939_05024 [Talaromyces rugulosus]
MVTKTYTVGPHNPFEAQYPLSSCDLQVPPVFTCKAFIYSTNGNLSASSPEAQGLVSRLQDSLVSFLQPISPGVLAYPQILGQIVKPVDGGRPCIAVKKSFSIQFKVVEMPDIEFSSLHHNGRFSVDAINIAGFRDGLDRASLMNLPEVSHNFTFQLTFINGGFVLLAQVAHQITDASGFAGFIRHWFQRARDGSSTYSQVESNPQVSLAMHDKSRLCQEDIQGDTDALRKLELAYKDVPTVKRPVAIGNGERVAKIFWVSAQSLKDLRTTLQAESANQPTSFQAVVALLWRCIIRTRLTPENNTPSTMSKGFLVTNMSQRLSPPLPKDFFGNSATWVFAEIPQSALLEEKRHASAINAIQKTLQEDTTELSLQLANQFISRQMQVGVYPPMDLTGNDVLFNSWEHFYPDLVDLDIGLGSFCTMRRLTDSIVPSLVLILPSYGRRSHGPEDKNPCQYPGGIEVQVHLFANQMELLQKDPEWLHYASTI